MSKAHVLRTAAAASDLTSLFAAAATLGLRIGWLDLGGADSVAPALESAAGAGAFRAVGVGASRVVSVKPVSGPKVLEDLLREHFAGCRAVVVRGDVPAPVLELAEAGYRIRFDDGSSKELSADGLARALRKPALRRKAKPDRGAS